MPRDGFLRETFVLPRGDARLKAREWFERPGDVIEFTIRRLPAAD